MAHDSNAAAAPAQNVVGRWFEGMPLTRAHWLAGAVLLFAFVIEAWEMMIIILSAGSIGAEFRAGPAEIGGLISAMFLGMIPGTLLWGKIANVIGRRTTLVVSLALYGVFPILSALAVSMEQLWWVRFGAGVILSGALVVTFPLLAELLPVRWRGRGAVLLSAGWPCGVLLAVLITATLSDLGWRWILGFSAVVSLWALAVQLAVPESAYWLAATGRTSAAQRVVARLSRRSVAAVEASGVGPEQVQSMPFFGIFAPRILPTTMLSTVVNFCFAWGYWGMSSWLPTLLAQKGLSTPQGLQFIALSALFMFPGYLFASYLTGILGRKKVMVTFVALATAAGFGFAYANTVQQLYAWNFVLSFFSLGAWGVWNTWLGEVYDTRNRGAGNAWGIMVQRVANTIAPIAIGAVLARSDFLTTVISISLFLAVTFATALFLPETEGQVLA